MAFTGSATVKQVTQNMVRITGLSLAAAAAGTIGLHGDSGAGVQLPDSFNPKPYDAFGGTVSLADSLEVDLWQAGAGAVAIPVIVAKGGSPFRITLTNATSGPGAASPALEIYIHFHE